MKKRSFAPSLHLAVSALLVVLWAPQQAAAQTGYYMTLVSRVCDDYTDIMANRARNNIQESLRDLGPDTVYASGEPVTPALEDANNNCQPLASPWGFTLGSSIGGQDEGSYGRLSYVNGVNGSVATVAQVPELDAAGTDTGRTIDWAVTIELTPEQVDLASRNALWVQGGSPGDPLNGQASVYGFGALRCAIDGLNGDNVESNKFPTGTQHVFCYAYYVNPPPTSGTIRVIKQQAGGDPATQTFEFRGNLSYQQNGSGDNYFNLDVQNGASSEIVFYRAETRQGDQPWTVWEEVPPGWNLDSASCVSGGGGSVITPAPGLGAGGQSIVLAAGDTVTCTYANEVQLPATGLLISKTSTDDDPENTIAAVGQFDFLVTGGGEVESLQITTQQENLPAIDRVLSGLPTGPQYLLEETSVPVSSEGDWALDAVNCLGQQPSGINLSSRTARLTLDGPAVCNFRNKLLFPAQLIVRKVTTNGVGRFTFTVGRPVDPAFQRTQDVVSSRVDVPSAPLVFDNIPYGGVIITESSASAAQWQLDDVVCNGQPVQHVNGSAAVVLSRAQPVVECVFTNTSMGEPFSPDIKPVPLLSGWAVAALGLLLGWVGISAGRERRATR